MRKDYILSALNLVLTGFGFLILIPIAVALIYNDYYSILPFFTASFISIFFGFICRLFTKQKSNFNDLQKKEGLFIVALTWISIAIIAAIPYLFYGLSPLNAYFEGVSGVTTTGATILTDFSKYPQAMFFWRSFSQWLGGMGVIVLFIAILPQFAVAGRQMFFAEAPGPTEEKIAPRIKTTATSLWVIYLSLTLIEIICLKIAGLPIFDAICNSLSTIAGGGFSPHQSSIIGYNNSAVIWIITLFMFLSGVNFSLQYRVVVQRQFKALLQNAEFFFYLWVFLGISAILTIVLIFHNHYEYFTALRDALFQTISVLTTAGFASVNFDNWTNSAKLLLFALMLIGGSAGSASGGIKSVRILIVLKYLWREITLILHPNAVIPLKLGKLTVPNEVLRQIIGFILFYFIILITSSLIVSALENDLLIGVVGSTATLGNVGPGFAQIGPMGSFDGLRIPTKIIFIFNMIVGRLELIPFLAMLHLGFWKFKK